MSSRSRSRSRSPRKRSRSPARRRRSPPRRSANGGRISLLVRNLDRKTGPEDLKEAFSKYGEIRDVYMPVDYYTKERRGFAFVEFIEEDGAHDAKREMDKRMFDGREISVLFAQDNRKTPDEMRRREDAPSSRGPPPRRRYRSRSRSRSHGRGRRRRRSRSRSRSPRRRSPSPRRRRKSPSPDRRRRSRSRSRSGSPKKAAAAADDAEKKDE